MTYFLTFFRAISKFVFLWITIDTDPNLPSPKCLII